MSDESLAARMVDAVRVEAANAVRDGYDIDKVLSSQAGRVALVEWIGMLEREGCQHGYTCDECIEAARARCEAWLEGR